MDEGRERIRSVGKDRAILNHPIHPLRRILSSQIIIVDGKDRSIHWPPLINIHPQSSYHLSLSYPSPVRLSVSVPPQDKQNLLLHPYQKFVSHPFLSGFQFLSLTASLAPRPIQQTGEAIVRNHLSRPLKPLQNLGHKTEKKTGIYCLHCLSLSPSIGRTDPHVQTDTHGLPTTQPYPSKTHPCVCFRLSVRIGKRTNRHS